MVLHYIIKKIISEYGKNIVSDLRLYNILTDLNAFKYEPESIKFVLKHVLLLRGKEILHSQERSLPVQATVNQYTQYITDSCGFIENQVRYVVESIAFGIGWLTEMNTEFTYIRSLSKRLEIAAYLYNIMGMNITQIKGHNDLYGSYHRSSDSFKNPIDLGWREYIIKQQSNDYLSTLSWDDKTGIGLVCGYNNIRAIDIDGLGCFENCDNDFWNNPRKEPNNKFDSFIEYCLHLLNLPKDYKWVVRSGSGDGIHIIFKCEDVEELKLNVSAFPSKKVNENLEPIFSRYGGFLGFNYKKNVELDFDKLELYWNGHLASYPSIGKDFDSVPYGLYKYQFINTNDTFPSDEPSTISVNDIDNLLITLCGTITTESPWERKNEHRSYYFHIAKLKNCQDSMGGYNHFKDTIQWLQKCTSKEGVNSLGVAYVMNKEYEKAAKCFIEANSDFSHYNYAQLILSDYIHGTKEELLIHYNECKNSKRIYEDCLNKLKMDIDNLH